MLCWNGCYNVASTASWRCLKAIFQHNTWKWLSEVEKIISRLWNYRACHTKAGVTFTPTLGSHLPLPPTEVRANATPHEVGANATPCLLYVYIYIFLFIYLFIYFFIYLFIHIAIRFFLSNFRNHKGKTKGSIEYLAGCVFLLPKWSCAELVECWWYMVIRCDTIPDIGMFHFRIHMTIHVI